MKVDVYADMACAWCRLATHRFHQAVTEAGVEPQVQLTYLPFQLDPDASEQPRPLIDELADLFGGRDAATGMLAEMTELGAGEGVEFRFDRALAVNTFGAHRLLWFALQRHGAGIQAGLAQVLYDAHFRDGRNIADHAELTALAGRAGLDGGQVAEFLGSRQGVEEVAGQVAAARHAGITTVPTFVFDDGRVLTGATDRQDLVEALRPAAA